jgi:hypothetical protein
MIRRKDALEQEFREKKAALFSEEVQKKLQTEAEGRRHVLTMSGGVAANQQRATVELETKAKVAGVEREFAKKRTELEADERLQRRMLDQETLKRRTEIEHKHALARLDIDTELRETKNRIQKEAKEKQRSGT